MKSHIITSDLTWKKIGEGVFIKHLVRDEASDRQTDLYKIEAGVVLNRHNHPKYEWVYVLEGSYADDSGEYQAGSLVINEAGYIHQSRSTTGCVLLVNSCGRHEAVDPQVQGLAQ